MQPLVPNLWFDDDAEQAATFYCSLFDDSRIISVLPYGPDTPGREGATMAVEWELLGRRYVGINGGPQFPFSEAFSLEARCDSQEELDTLWAALVEAGTPSQCGWLKDRYGFSWQVTPAVLSDMLADPDPAKVARATQYFLGLDGVPFDIAALEAAFDGEGVSPTSGRREDRPLRSRPADRGDTS